MVIKSIAYLFNKTCETVLDDVIRSTKKVEKEKRDKSNDLHQIYDRFQSPNELWQLIEANRRVALFDGIIELLLF